MNKNIFGKIRNYILTICFILPFTVVGHAQKKKYKDYIVSNKDDTIYGKFKKPLLGQLRFESGEDLYDLDPQLYKSYYDSKEKKMYERKMINDKPMWLTCIVNGPIKLYEQFYNTTQVDGRMVSVRIWLAQKENTPLMEVQSSSLTVQKPVGKQNLEYLIRDNPKLYSKLQQVTNYNYKIAKVYIDAYNESMQ